MYRLSNLHRVLVKTSEACCLNDMHYRSLTRDAALPDMLGSLVSGPTIHATYQTCCSAVPRSWMRNELLLHSQHSGTGMNTSDAVQVGLCRRLPQDEVLSLVFRPLEGSGRFGDSTTGR